jgi:hypothetical protein
MSVRRSLLTILILMPSTMKVRMSMRITQIILRGRIRVMPRRIVRKRRQIVTQEAMGRGLRRWAIISVRTARLNSQRLCSRSLLYKG